MEPEQPAGQPKPAPMPGTVGVFNVFGVPVRLHFTFLLLVVFLLYLGLSGRQSGAATASYVLALFGSVFTHELGHAMVARRFGIKTVDIVMFPIGGVARLEREPRPGEEVWLAIAGPLVNLVVAGTLFGYLWYMGKLVHPAQLLQATDENLLERIGVGNLVLAVFNQLPAFPMDGGRILRSILSRFRGHEEATRIAAKAGRLMAGLIGLYGLLSMNFLLVFVALFVYLGANQDTPVIERDPLTDGIPVRSAMITDFRTLPHGAEIRAAADLLIATSQQDFPVVFGDRVVGLLGRTDLIKAMISEGSSLTVSSAMKRDFQSVAPADPLNEAMRKLSHGDSCALVLEEGHLVGLLTIENISEFLLLRKIGIVKGPDEA